MPLKAGRAFSLCFLAATLRALGSAQHVGPALEVLPGIQGRAVGPAALPALPARDPDARPTLRTGHLKPGQ